MLFLAVKNTTETFMYKFLCAHVFHSFGYILRMEWLGPVFSILKMVDVCRLGESKLKLEYSI